MKRLVGAASRALLVRWCVAERRLHRATDRVTRALGGVVWATSTPDERNRLAFALHDALEHPTTKATAGLFDWERRWYDEVLPRPPARILVGAAGSGREVLALLDAGYAVDAFEPAPQAWRALQANAGGRARLWQLSYQQLVERLEDGDPNAPQQGAYDAVILGWGSFACLVDNEDRARVVLACDALAPRGSILVSTPLATDRIRTLGRAGVWAARLVGGSGPSAGTWLVGSGGFMHPLGRTEIDHLGRAVGRSTRWGFSPGYPHFAWTLPESR